MPASDFRTTGNSSTASFPKNRPSGVRVSISNLQITCKSPEADTCSREEIPQRIQEKGLRERMAEYGRAQAREWAREHMKGVYGCMMPTLNNSLTGINEKAIRHDLRQEKKLGFRGCLLVSECGTTLPEMREVIDVSVDEALQLDLHTILLASFSTLEETVQMVQYAEASGVDLVMIAYPLLFYPRNEQEVYDFTRAVADKTELGIILFCDGIWNFERFHPSGFPPDLVGRLVEDLPNVVAIKNHTGKPGVAGIAEIFHRFGDEVLVCDQLEINTPAWVLAFGMQFLGTSNYEYLGDTVPRYFQLLQEGHFDEAMQLYWKVHPARLANSRVTSSFYPGTALVHRMVWKYQYWLNGFNGGPIRQPHPRLSDSQMRILRSGLVKSGIEPVSR